ncbi:hypothetical protein [Novosphingopyxis sp.]|uniref:hypothetical protein n=1 Tax=Novosphingopyxis sp. TaxID=2709690 RepID=UPI003B5C417A
MAKKFISALNQGDDMVAAPLLDPQAIIRDMTEEKEVGADEFLRLVNENPSADYRTVVGQLSDGSNVVVLKVSIQGDPISEIWVFGVGSGCITDIWKH